jgi:hypothetical protein
MGKKLKDDEIVKKNNQFKKTISRKNNNQKNMNQI